MGYTPITPFRRTVEAAVLAHQAHAAAELPPQGVNKWEALRELATARSVFGLSDRDITVLQALISFHPGAVLGGTGKDSALVVHPSNISICERLNGMANSTMRRHLARLVQSGIVIRRDSPNGKRYARRYGDEKIVYGFDLSPLVARFAEFCAAAETLRAAEQRHKRLRETVSLMRRDLAGLADYGETLRPDLGLWDALSDLARLVARDLRRKLPLDELEGIRVQLESGLVRARGVIEGGGSGNMSTSEGHNERLYQNSTKDEKDSEPCVENIKAADAGPPGTDDARIATIGESNAQETRDDEGDLPNVPLGLVLAACPEIRTYAEGGIRHWHELVRTAEIVRPMMGISPSAWDDAKRAMGAEQAAVVAAVMLERFAEIRAPGGYLRHLTAKAEVRSVFLWANGHGVDTQRGRVKSSQL